MAKQVILDIGTADQGRVIDALCAAGGKPDGGGDKDAFAKKVIIDFINSTVHNVEASAAAAAVPVPAVKPKVDVK